MQQARLTRQDRMYILAKACVEKDVNPNKGNLQTLLQTHYNDLETEVRGNILLFYWDGKTATRNMRDLTRIIQPKNPVYHYKNNPEGDILEDDEGVVSEQASGIKNLG